MTTDVKDTTMTEADTGRVIVTDTGFSSVRAAESFVLPDALPQSDTALAVDLASDADPTAIADRIGDIALIRIDFPAHTDGRGFTIARQLRRLGYRGRLRAAGHVIADQYAMARRSGFDEVEIDAHLARRQPEDQWLARASWQDHDYGARLGRRT